MWWDMYYDDCNLINIKTQLWHFSMLPTPYLKSIKFHPTYVALILSGFSLTMHTNPPPSLFLENYKKMSTKWQECWNPKIVHYHIMLLKRVGFLIPWWIVIQAFVHHKYGGRSRQVDRQTDRDKEKMLNDTDRGHPWYSGSVLDY